MISFIEPLVKAEQSIQFGWNPEYDADVASYKVYVGQITGSLSLLAEKINPQVSYDPSNFKKIIYNANLEDVQTLLGLASTVTFGDILLYWAITYVNKSGAESPISESSVIAVPPVGIYGKTRKEDPSANRFIFGFSDEIQRWIKLGASSSGALITSSGGFYQENLTTEYTYDGTNLASEKFYPSDSTNPGSPAKLVTYTYTGSDLTMKVVTDSTV